MTSLRTRLVSAAALALAACAHTPPPPPSPAVPVAPPPVAATPPPPARTPDAAFRASKPEPAAGPIRFDAPVPIRRTLANGAELLLVESHAVPLVSVTVLIETGVDGEPAGKGGLAKFVATLLTEGTKKRSATELAEQIEDLSTILFASAGQETIQLRVNSLKETLPQSLDLMADVLTNPAFRKEDVERQRGLMLTDLERKRADTGLLARDEMARLTYGDKHPWGQPWGGTSASIHSITVADLARFHERYFRPANAIISVAGDVTEAEIVGLLQEKLAGWKRRPRLPVSLPHAQAKQHRRGVVLVDKPDASQSQVWLFGPAVAAKDPDAMALRVASFILGGPFARLDLNIREDKGYSYGARTSLQLLRDHGTWTAASNVKADVTAESVAELEKELTAFVAPQLKPGELDNAKAAMVRVVPTLLERDDAISGAMAVLAFNGQPLDYFRTLPERVAAVDAAAVARVAGKYDRPAEWPIIVVGPRRASEQKLRAMQLGDVTVKEVEHQQ